MQTGGWETGSTGRSSCMMSRRAGRSAQRGRADPACVCARGCLEAAARVMCWAGTCTRALAGLADRCWLTLQRHCPSVQLCPDGERAAKLTACRPTQAHVLGWQLHTGPGWAGHAVG
jgi:hypothetical protein